MANALVKYTNTTPEKSLVNKTANLFPFKSAGSMGPAGGVWTNCNNDVGRVLDCLFLLWKKFPSMQISQFLLLVPLPLIFIPSTTSGNLTIKVVVTQYFMRVRISVHSRQLSPVFLLSPAVIKQCRERINEKKKKLNWILKKWKT